MIEFIVVFLLIVNVLAFVCMRSNKHGRFSKYKIDKGTIFLLSLLGGSLGTLIGMRYYNYLRDNILFKIGVPVLLILQVILLLIAVFQ